MAFKNLFKQAEASIMVPNDQKTRDPQYLEAKAKFDKLTEDGGKFLGTISQFNAKLSAFAEKAVKFSQNLDQFASEGESDFRSKSKVALQVSEFLKNDIATFFSPNLESSFIKFHAECEVDASKARELKESHAEVNRLYDLAKYKLNKAVTKNQKSHDVPPEEIQHLQEKEDKTKDEYEKATQGFIEAVDKLEVKKIEAMNTPPKKLVALLSQFINRQIKELQKFRSVSSALDQEASKLKPSSADDDD